VSTYCTRAVKVLNQGFLTLLFWGGKATNITVDWLGRRTLKNNIGWHIEGSKLVRNFVVRTKNYTCGRGLDSSLSKSVKIRSKSLFAVEFVQTDTGLWRSF
jgi:hypothetical protein